MDIPEKYRDTHESELKAIEVAYPTAKERLEFLYANLSIIDSKSSALLGFNAIGLTAIAVWLAYIPANAFHVALDVIFLLFLISCVLCLKTVNLYWSPPEIYTKHETQALELLECRRVRTKQYRAAWRTSLFAVVLLIVASLYHEVGTLLKATGSCEYNSACWNIFSSGIPSSS